MSVKMCVWIGFLVCLTAMTISLMWVHDLQVHDTGERIIYGPSRIIAKASAGAMKPCLALCLVVSTPGFLPAVRYGLQAEHTQVPSLMAFDPLP